MVNHPNRFKPGNAKRGLAEVTAIATAFPAVFASPPKLEIGVRVRVRPGGNYAGKEGIIRDIGPDCSGHREYVVEFTKPVTVAGKKYKALPFYGPSLKVISA